MAEEKRCLLCNGKIRYSNRYTILKAGDNVVEVACLMQLIKEKKWKVDKQGKEEGKDKLKPKKKQQVKK